MAFRFVMIVFRKAVCGDEPTRHRLLGVLDDVRLVKRADSRHSIYESVERGKLRWRDIHEIRYLP